MKKIGLIVVLVTTIGFSQTKNDSIKVDGLQQNGAQSILNGKLAKGVTLGGYGQVDYNQKEGDNGVLDVHRMVLLLGYKFNDKVQFITEIEFEHVKEVFVEQAFLNYTVANQVNLRAGLMLVPMGIVNEYHEPTTFNGVERPSMDKSIIPTTWREVGIGVSGRIDNANLKYQAYIFNGFASVSGSKVLGGLNGLRNGRQKGAKSTVNSPTFSTKFEYYGIQGLRLGLSGYFGRTQPADDIDAVDGADVGITMLGIDARYNYRRFTARGQFINTSITDTEAYNDLNSAKLGSKLQGWYVEGAYNLLSQTKTQKLIAFARYEDFDTQASVEGALTKNLAYDRDEITFGLSYHIAPGAVVKADYQIKKNAVSNAEATKQFNFGIGVWF